MYCLWPLPPPPPPPPLPSVYCLWPPQQIGSTPLPCTVCGHYAPLSMVAERGRVAERGVQIFDKQADKFFGSFHTRTQLATAWGTVCGHSSMSSEYTPPVYCVWPLQCPQPSLTASASTSCTVYL